jgi:salicylate hydroxylase
MSELRVTVIGGGIGGAATALALTRAGCDAHVYEQVASKTEVGAGIQLRRHSAEFHIEFFAIDLTTAGVELQ